MHTHTTTRGDVFLPSAIMAPPHRNKNRRRPEPPAPLGVWLLIAISSAIASITTYLLTK
jgi:hypothetical protein